MGQMSNQEIGLGEAGRRNASFKGGSIEDSMFTRNNFREWNFRCSRKLKGESS